MLCIVYESALRIKKTFVLTHHIPQLKIFFNKMCGNNLCQKIDSNLGAVGVFQCEIAP